MPASAAVRRALRLSALAILICAPLVTLAFVARFGVNGADWDHLIASELFTRWDEGTLTLSRMYAQHNEHRPVVPRLVVMGLGWFTRFNNLPEMYLQWVLLVSTGLLLARAFTRETAPPGSWEPFAVVPIVLLLFSVRQYEILLIGEGLLTYLSLAFVVSALYCLVGRPASRGSLALAIVATILASFSQSNALLVWPIGLMVLVLGLRTRMPRYGFAAIAVWTVSAAAVLWLYFRNYADPPNHPSARFLLEYPKVALSYFFIVGGGPLGGERWSTFAMGVAMLLFEIAVVVGVLREYWQTREPMPLGIWLIACAAATQVMITANRAGFGLEQALASRYSTYLGLAPIGVYWCAWKYRVRWRAAGERLVTAVVAVILVGWLSASVDAWFAAKEFRSAHEWHAYLLYTAKYQPDSLLQELYSNPTHARSYAAGLERLRYNVYADDHVDPKKVMLTSVRPPFFLDAINGRLAGSVKTLEVADDQPVILDGWALDSGAVVPASAVFVSIDGTIEVPCMMAGDRPDLVPVFHSPAARGGGFRASFSAALLTPGVHRVSLKIVANDRTHAFLTEPLFDVLKR